MSETQSGQVQGGRDVVDVLTSDHQEALELIDQIRASQDPSQRRDLADTLIAEIVRHSVAEEMHVYPVMRDRLPDGEEAVNHDTEEHKEIERTMKEMESVDAADARFMQLVGDLERILRDHVQDEEGEQFPKLRTHVSADDLRELGDKVETAKKLAPTRPHPMAPNNELFHKTLGPGAGLVDRLRDKLTGRSTG